MPQLTPITKKNHTEKSWTKFTSYQFASKDNLAPLAGVEISKAITSLPMAFVKQQDRFILVAVLSFTTGTNLFVGPDGRWLGGYVPSVFRGYPFCLAKVERKDDLVLCVDERSGLVNADKSAGEPFFDEAGELSQSIKDVMNFLNQVEQSRAATHLAVVSLAEADVISEWPLKVQDGDQEKPVTGLYRIDETKFNSLEDEKFLKIRKAGAMPIAYAQLLSMGNIQMFAQLARAHEQLKKTGPDIKPILGDDDMISFS